MRSPLEFNRQSSINPNLQVTQRKININNRPQEKSGNFSKGIKIYDNSGIQNNYANPENKVETYKKFLSNDVCFTQEKFDKFKSPRLLSKNKNK